MSWVSGHFQNGKWVGGYYRRDHRITAIDVLAVMAHPEVQKGAWALNRALWKLLLALVGGIGLLIFAAWVSMKLSPATAHPTGQGTLVAPHITPAPAPVAAPRAHHRASHAARVSDPAPADPAPAAGAGVPVPSRHHHHHHPH